MSTQYTLGDRVVVTNLKPVGEVTGEVVHIYEGDPDGTVGVLIDAKCLQGIWKRPTRGQRYMPLEAGQVRPA